MPDLLWRTAEGFDKLGDVKTICLCPTQYRPARLRQGVRGRCVQERAANVNVEYIRSARGLDERFCGVPHGTDGPVLRKLQSFDSVIGLVFGAFGEASTGVRQLVDYAATAAADRFYADMGARSPAEAARALRLRFRRELGLANLREHMHLKLRRLDAYVRGSLFGFSRSAAGDSGSDGQHAARRTSYEDTQGFRDYTGWAPPRPAH